MKFFRNKYLISILAVLIVVLVFFFVIKAVNANSKSCNADSDCVFYRTECCYSCGTGDSMNKKYLTTLETERFMKCLFTNLECSFFFRQIVDCLPPIDAAFRKPYCNENKICDSKIDCEAFCEEFGGMEDDMPTREFGCECS